MQNARRSDNGDHPTGEFETDERLFQEADARLRDPSKQELMTSADAVALARRIDALGSEELETKNSKSGGAGSTTRGARNTAPAA